MNGRLWVVVVAAVTGFVAVDLVLWLAVGWVSAGQPQAAMIAAASALPVALIGVVGSMLGAWRTHVGLLDRERLVRFQAEKLDACVKVLTFADQYGAVRSLVDELKERHGQADAESVTREERIRGDLLYARSMLAILGAGTELSAKAKTLACDVLDGKAADASRAAFAEAVRSDLRL